MDRTITIRTTAQHIKDIFFKDGSYDVFSSEATRRVRQGFLWVIFVCGAFILFGINMPNPGGWIGIASTVIIGQTVLLGLAFHNLNKQRHHLEDFARSTEKSGAAELRVTDKGFCITIQGADHIERWDHVSKATIAHDHIHILAATSYLFPKAAMPEEDFTWLSEIVRARTFQDENSSAFSETKRPIGFIKSDTVESPKA